MRSTAIQAENEQRRPPGELRVEAGWDVRAHRLRPRLKSVARRVLRDEYEAADAVDEAVARLVEGVRSGEIHGDPGPWLHRTVLNLAIDRARAWARRQRMLRAIPPDSEKSGRRADPGDAAARSELREAVWRGILELPSKQQEVLVLRDMEGLSYDEVGEALAIQASTARAHAYAARETLRQKLRQWKGMV